MDWGAKASWIALIVAIISPAITTYLNNRFQLKAKSIDYEFSKQSEYYQYQKNCYENFIKFASKHNETDIPITERIFSADFPISLQSSQGIFEIVLFDIPANIKLSKDFITLKIITNKKNKIYTLQVPKESKDLLSI